MAEKQKCFACDYWLQVDFRDGNLLGQCRRNPPHYEGWPLTFHNDWCGEHAPHTEDTLQH